MTSLLILGYYGTAGTAAFQYQAFGVGDGTWSTNGTDPMTFLGGYAQPDTYGMLLSIALYDDDLYSLYSLKLQ